MELSRIRDFLKQFFIFNLNQLVNKLFTSFVLKFAVVKNIWSSDAMFIQQCPHITMFSSSGVSHSFLDRRRLLNDIFNFSTSNLPRKIRLIDHWLGFDCIWKRFLEMKVWIGWKWTRHSIGRDWNKSIIFAAPFIFRMMA